jgi:single-stranded DNA-binding protein
MNVLTVTGHLTTDPARRDTAKGVVCEFRVLVDGQRRLWLPVVVWGHLAGVCRKHLHTGRRVAVSGQLCVDEYISTGETKRRWYLRGEHVTFLDARARPAADPSTAVGFDAGQTADACRSEHGASNHGDGPGDDR